MKKNAFGNWWERDRIRYKLLCIFGFEDTDWMHFHFLSYSIFCSLQLAACCTQCCYLDLHAGVAWASGGSISFLDHCCHTSPCNNEARAEYQHIPKRISCVLRMSFHDTVSSQQIHLFPVIRITGLHWMCNWRYSFAEILLFFSLAERITGQSFELTGYILVIFSPFNAMPHVVYYLEGKFIVYSSNSISLHFFLTKWV